MNDDLSFFNEKIMQLYLNEKEFVCYDDRFPTPIYDEYGNPEVDEVGNIIEEIMEYRGPLSDIFLLFYNAYFPIFGSGQAVPTSSVQKPPLWFDDFLDYTVDEAFAVYTSLSAALQGLYSDDVSYCSDGSGTNTPPLSCLPLSWSNKKQSPISFTVTYTQHNGQYIATFSISSLEQLILWGLIQYLNQNSRNIIKCCKNCNKLYAKKSGSLFCSNKCAIIYNRKHQSIYQKMYEAATKRFWTRLDRMEDGMGIYGSAYDDWILWAKQYLKEVETNSTIYGTLQKTTMEGMPIPTPEEFEKELNKKWDLLIDGAKE